MTNPTAEDNSTDLSDSSTEVSDDADMTGNIVPSVACRLVTITFSDREHHRGEGNYLTTEEVS